MKTESFNTSTKEYNRRRDDGEKTSYNTLGETTFAVSHGVHLLQHTNPPRRSSLCRGGGF